jgi:hypothetical protein
MKFLKNIFNILKEKAIDNSNGSDNFLSLEYDKVNAPKSLQEMIRDIKMISQIDDFENSETITFEVPAFFHYVNICMFENTSHGNPINHLGLNFRIFNHQLVLDFQTNIQGFNLAIGDRIILLFENKANLDITFNYNDSNGYNYHLLTPDEMKFLINQKLDKWKLISTRRAIHTIGDNTQFYKEYPIQNKEIFQQLLQHMATLITKEYTKGNSDFEILI